jgi:hypothetical protein
MLSARITSLNKEVEKFRQINVDLNNLFNSIQEWILSKYHSKIKYHYYSWILNRKMKQLHDLHDNIVTLYKDFGVGGRLMGHYDVDLEIISEVIYGYNDKLNKLLELNQFNVYMPDHSFNQVPIWHD